MVEMAIWLPAQTVTSRAVKAPSVPAANQARNASDPWGGMRSHTPGRRSARPAAAASRAPGCSASGR